LEYYFNELDPTSFQRLINAILVKRLGVDARLTPLRGADGGRDAETAPGNPFMEYVVTEPSQEDKRLKSGRYIFQVKHHRTADAGLAGARRAVVADFSRELRKNVIPRQREETVNYFIVVTNVPASQQALSNLDRARRKLLRGLDHIHADVWWQEQVMSFLDQMPELWQAFPQMFSGGRPPLVTYLAGPDQRDVTRTLRLAVSNQYDRDRIVRFRQIDLERTLSRLFVDLDLEAPRGYFRNPFDGDPFATLDGPHEFVPHPTVSNTALKVIIGEYVGLRRVLLEGGPGQGKSTATQMAAQIFRNLVLKGEEVDPEERWKRPRVLRLPLRIELRFFGEWLSKHNDGRYGGIYCLPYFSGFWRSDVLCRRSSNCRRKFTGTSNL
jgi:hypothetical protein